MQEQITEILSAATSFMTVEEIADKGKWRSHGNVAVAIHNMAKTPGVIVSRKSKTKKLLNDRPAEEFALAEKEFAKKVVAEQSKAVADVTPTNKGDIAQGVDIQVPVFRKSRTTPMPADKECCNAAKVVATTAGSEVAALNARIEAMEDEISQRNVEIASLKAKLQNATNRADNMNTVSEKWNELAKEFECRGIPELRVFINSLIKRAEDLKEASANDVQVVDVKDADYFAVHRPRRGLQRFKKLESAKTKAEVGARVDGQAELYAMVLVDVAKNGAIWNGRKAA